MSDGDHGSDNCGSDGLYSTRITHEYSSREPTRELPEEMER